MSDTYPKPSRTCEVVSGEPGQPGTMVRCAHCGEPFKTTAWNWQRKNFTRRACQEAQRKDKASSGGSVTRRKRAVAVSDMTETFPEQVSAPAAVDVMHNPSPFSRVVVFGSPEQSIAAVALADEGQAAPGVVLTERDGPPPRVDVDPLQARNRHERRAEAGPLDFTGSTRAREGRTISTCPVCGARAEKGESPWGGTLYLHKGKLQASGTARMKDFCVVDDEGGQRRYLQGRRVR